MAFMIALHSTSHDTHPHNKQSKIDTINKLSRKNAIIPIVQRHFLLDHEITAHIYITFSAYLIL
ncbi:hypothetical protein CTM88_09235 [Photobacterium aquimaris]|uniref:Uncharacterized protein n=1 Tax=Photobacterium aquimaris TaxID=512643 RepID=A0A2T3ILD1_9GAMM|nr:hypothetical protein AYY20_11595 [Photobacterium aquimaris]PSU29184.1 hypothetical protein CTM88_09235 [Photobacterium aquimaris]